MAVLNNATPSQGVFNMTLSSKGPIVIPQYMDFTSGIDEVEFDGTFFTQNGVIDFISGCYVNNFSDEELSIRVNGTGQIITIGAHSWGYVPLLATAAPKFLFSFGTSPDVILLVHFYNIPLLPFVSSSEGGGTPVTGDWLTDAELRATPVDVAFSSTPMTLSDFTFDMTGGNEVAVAAGDAARYLVIQNPVGNNDVTVNIAGGDASVSGFVLMAGGTYENNEGFGNAVNVSGTAAETLVIFAGA